ncbi:hypothetical protein SAMD00019534_072360, partial [Acytostelium subglobosum LB1]|uniref:hypothetical protein n=1 Tax=Acytostelium subglobosum LB1 TaxID=1410327 RepID=UPI000644C9A9
MTRRFFVGGNYKMNGTKESIQNILSHMNTATLPSQEVVDVIVSPPSIYLTLAQGLVNPRIKVAAQNCHSNASGAFTGEISVGMCKDIGLEWVIIGHSERRKVFGESDEFIAKKVKAVIDGGLSVIFCIGEQLSDRQSGKTNDVIAQQLSAVLTSVPNWTRVVIAYEPVWAIGTGVVATPQQAQDAHKFIRSWLSSNVSAAVAGDTRVIYGGSVSASNCAELSKETDIDGFLVGGASLVAADFVTIVSTAHPKSSL